MKHRNVIKKQRQLKRKNIKKFKRILLDNLNEMGGAQAGDAILLDLIFENIPRFKEFKLEVIKAVGEDGWEECLNYIQQKEK